MEIKNENPVIAIAAWINPNATVRPVSVMMEQKGEPTNLIGFMMGQKNRRTVNVSFTKDVAKSIGIDVDSLKEGYDNVTPININLSEALPFAVRIRIVETTDEVWAKENYAFPKKSGKEGVELVTADGEMIYRKLEFVEVKNDGSSDDQLVAHISLKDMSQDIKEALASKISATVSESIKAVF